ncbi:hypothetical protein D9M71_418890 [compost metagenome]
MLVLQLFGEQIAEIAVLADGELGEDRRQFGLRIDRPAQIGFAVEMDRQVGNHRDGRLEVDQLAFHLAGEAEGDAAGQRQVAVEPRGEQGAAVDFHAQLPVTLASQFRIRLDAQAGAVGVRADQAQAALQQRGVAELEGDQRGVVAGHVITATGLGAPGIALIETLEAGLFETAGEALGGMERGGGGREEVDQALVEFCTHG